MKNILILIFYFTMLLILINCERDLDKINKPIVNDLGKIEGFIKESVTQSPICRADISIINSTSVSVLSDSMGYYLFSDVKPGNYLLQSIKDGYRKDSLLIEVEPNKISRADLYLTKIDTSLISEIYYFYVNEGYPNHDTVCEPQIKLNLNTEKIFGCCNFKIRTNLSIENDTIRINILDIYLDGDCLTLLGPATAEIFLNISEGNHWLFINDSYSIDKFQLTLTDSSIQLNEINSQHTIPRYTMFWRYPSNSFAYLCGTTTPTNWICDDFLDTLLLKIQLQSIFFPDSGEIGYPYSSQGHYYDMPAKYFIYNSEADFDSAGNLLKLYSHNVISQYSGVSVSIVNWKNQKYYSRINN